MAFPGAGLGSSAIGDPLHSIVRVVRDTGVFLLLSTWAGQSLTAQASNPHGAESSALPRFTLREIILGSKDTVYRIPGAWLRAATRERPDSLAGFSYAASASRSGIVPLESGTLASQRSQHVMGLYRRSELVRATIATLESIRAAIPSDTTRARFDRIFHNRGTWVVDLHDAAMAWARSQGGDIDWEAASKALRQSGWIARGDTAGGLETVPRALYALRVLAASDSIGFAAVQADLRAADPASAAAVTLLLRGYAEAERWYVEAVEFFLREPWAVRGGEGHSIGDLVREDWQRVRRSSADTIAPIPEIHTRLFGYAQAVPHYGVPPLLLERLVGSRNETARDWRREHGSPALLRTLHRLPAGDTSLVLLQVGLETIRLSSVPRQAQENLNGFLEPGDLIAIDPGYSPVLALGAVVHEWQHLLFHRFQLDDFVATLPPTEASIVHLPGIHPYLAEGFAEWSAERILQPLIDRWPLIGLGELEKRAGLARENPEDQHPLGYALVRELAAVLHDPALTTRVLLRFAEVPARIAAEPPMRKAWQRFRNQRDYRSAAPARRVLIPEITFTIEDGYPDVVASRILVPPSRKGLP